MRKIIDHPIRDAWDLFLGYRNVWMGTLGWGFVTYSNFTRMITADEVGFASYLNLILAVIFLLMALAFVVTGLVTKKPLWVARYSMVIEAHYYDDDQPRIEKSVPATVARLDAQGIKHLIIDKHLHKWERRSWWRWARIGTGYEKRVGFLTYADYQKALLYV